MFFFFDNSQLGLYDNKENKIDYSGYYKKCHFGIRMLVESFTF